MAFNQAKSSQIKLNSITNEHIKVGTLIDGTKLNIDWTAKGAEILASKLLVDYVQVDGQAIGSGTSAVTVTPQISASPASSDEVKGAVVQSGKNKVIIRDSVTGEPVVSSFGTEVYGQLTHNGTDYIVTFFTKDGGGVEQSHTFVDASVIDFQFPQRFDFNTIAENFAANEKFVDGAADVSTRLDFEQIVKDVFGASYTLDQDGAANRAKTIAQELIDETSGVTNTNVKAKNIIDEVIDARGVSLTLDAELTRIEGKTDTLKSDLADVAAGKGASLIGVEDIGGKFIATTVEGVLAEMENRLSSVESTGGTEVAEARKSTALTGTEVVHASLDDRLEASETVVKATNDEVVAARGAFASVDARLDDIETDAAGVETRVQALEGKDHEHFVFDKQVLAADPVIGTNQLDLPEGITFVAGNKSLQVYMNGFLQMVGVHYIEVETGGVGTGVNFAPELIAQDDVIQLRWVK